ncbi:hypothetical protein QFZ58_000176 [Streptomyces sp. B1I3]|nr:hypothetical protein [Streptomyces sp. B1I3]
MARVGVREIACHGGGRTGRRWVDPSGFACRGLAAELADVWVDYHHKNALRAHGAYPTAVVSFATFVSAHLPTLGSTRPRSAWRMIASMSRL